jgi:hypothetical protein
MTEVEVASCATGVYEAVAPLRQLYVVQIIRLWVEILFTLTGTVLKTGSGDVPNFSEVFRGFCNPDSYIKTRKTWDTV